MPLFIQKEGVFDALRTMIIDNPLKKMLNSRFQHTEHPAMTIEETREFEKLTIEALYPDSPDLQEIYAKDIRTSPLLPHFHLKEWLMHVRIKDIRSHVTIQTPVADKWALNHPRYKHTPIIISAPMGSFLKYNFYIPSSTVMVDPSSYTALYRFLTVPYKTEIQQCVTLSEELQSFFFTDEQNYFHNIAPKDVYNTYRSLFTYIPLFRAIYLDKYHGKDPILKNKRSTAEIVLPPTLTAVLTAQLLQSV